MYTEWAETKKYNIDFSHGVLCGIVCDGGPGCYRTAIGITKDNLSKYTLYAKNDEGAKSTCNSRLIFIGY